MKIYILYDNWILIWEPGYANALLSSSTEDKFITLSKEQLRICNRVASSPLIGHVTKKKPNSALNSGEDMIDRIYAQVSFNCPVKFSVS
jgi:hypothetical protein